MKISLVKKRNIKVNLTEKIPKNLQKAYLYIHKNLSQKGFDAYLVGGTVRDLLLNRKIHDLDIATNAQPNQIKKIFPNHIPVGEQFGTIMVLYRTSDDVIPVEVTTYRSESLYKDGRHPDKIVWGKSIEEDVLRRDFTVNGLYYNASSLEIIDYVDGMNDLGKKILRTIGDPRDRFTEDGLRPIRACRFAAVLNFKMNENMIPAIFDTHSVIKSVSWERIMDEIRKVQKSMNLDLFWKNMRETGIFHIFFQDIDPGSENYNIFLRMIKGFSKKDLEFTFASLLFLKKQTESLSEKEIKTYLKAKKLPMTTLNKVMVILRNPPDFLFRMLCRCEGNSLDTKAFFYRIWIKKYLTNVNLFDEKLVIRFYFSVREMYFKKMLKNCKNGLLQKQYSFESEMFFLYQIYREIKKKNEPYRLDEIEINGNDVKKFGFKGKIVGNILEKVKNYVIKYPAMNQKSKLLHYIEKHF